MHPRLTAALRRIDGLDESPSAFNDGMAWWCNGTEVVHGDAPDAVDIRLTREVIRELRDALRSDPRVTLRRSTSDWVEVRCRPGDVEFVVHLVERAVAAHLPADGRPPTPAPTGADLERRRRFH